MKRILSALWLLALSLAVAFVFASCGDTPDAPPPQEDPTPDVKLEGTEISSALLSVESDTISGLVSNATESFSFNGDIEVAEGATYIVARDI